MENNFEIDLKRVKSAKLLEQFGKLAASERKIMQQVIEYVAEIDRRKLYLKRAYSSLFEMLTKEFGYTEGSAARRIDAARFMRGLSPEAKTEFSQQLEDGAINLSQVSMVEKMSRQVLKDKKRQVTTEEKIELLSKIENQNLKQTEVILASALKIEVAEQTKDRWHGDGSVTLPELY